MKVCRRFVLMEEKLKSEIADESMTCKIKLGLSAGRVKWKDRWKKEEKGGLCFIFLITFFQLVLRLPDVGSSPLGCSTSFVPKHDVGAACQLLKHPSLVAPTQMTVLSVSLHSIYGL